VALLVDLWDGGAVLEPARGLSGAAAGVSSETAVLVVNAALSGSDANAQLVAAEVLCRNSCHLDICQSLHWPASVDGAWNPRFGIKTKVLIVDALVRMAYTSAPSLNALQSLTVRLYCIAANDPDPRVKGCLGMLLNAVLPALDRLGVQSLMQGPSELTIDDLHTAASRARPNPDRVFYKVVLDRSAKLASWAETCDGTDCRPGALAAAWASPEPA
jgi:hypothetical protein